jgi:hypothetical protein
MYLFIRGGWGYQLVEFEGKIQDVKEKGRNRKDNGKEVI